MVLLIESNQRDHFKSKTLSNLCKNNMKWNNQLKTTEDNEWKKT